MTLARSGEGSARGLTLAMMKRIDCEPLPLSVVIVSSQISPSVATLRRVPGSTDEQDPPSQLLTTLPPIGGRLGEAEIGKRSRPRFDPLGPSRSEASEHAGMPTV